jgi:hypothetical protein
MGIWLGRLRGDFNLFSFVVVVVLIDLCMCLGSMIMRKSWMITR